MTPPEIPQETLAALIGDRLYDTPTLISDQLGLGSDGRLCWPRGTEPR